jgi:hypothetical protein
MDEGHAHKEFPVIHVLHLKGVLLHPKEATTRVA